MLTQVISRTADQDELFAQLNVFLRELAESGLGRRIPVELRPLQIGSDTELRTWLQRVQSEVDRQEAAGHFGEETLCFLQDALQAASERIRCLSSAR